MALPVPLLLALAGGAAYLLSQSSKAKAAAPSPAPSTPQLPPSAPSAPAPIPAGATMPETLKAQLEAVLKALKVQPPRAEAVQVATELAGRLAAAGFHAEAERLREIAAAVMKQIPKQPPSEEIPASTLPPDLQEKLTNAIRFERDPVKLQKLAVALKALPNANEPQIQLAIQMIEALIAQVSAGREQDQALEEVEEVLKSPVRSPGLPTGSPAPGRASTMPVLVPEPVKVNVPSVPIPQPAPKPKTPNQTAAEGIALQMLQLEKNHGLPKAKGKEDRTLVKKFQSMEKLGTDGKAGPSVMLAVARYVGNLPHVWYWPKAATKADVDKYRAGLLAESMRAAAAGDVLRAEALKASAARENGEGGINGPAPVKLPPLPAAPITTMPVPSPSVPLPAPSPSVPASPAAAAALAMTTNLLDVLIAAGGNVTAAKGKENQALVKAFQAMEGAGTPDGKAGPGTLKAAAKYTGELPLVFYWPKASTTKTVIDYRKTLAKMATDAADAGDVDRAKKLLQSANREKGQGGVAITSTLPPL